MCDQLLNIVYKSALLSNTAAGYKRFILKSLRVQRCWTCKHSLPPPLNFFLFKEQPQLFTYLAQMMHWQTHLHCKDRPSAFRHFSNLCLLVNLHSINLCPLENLHFSNLCPLENLHFSNLCPLENLHLNTDKTLQGKLMILQQLLSSAQCQIILAVVLHCIALNYITHRIICFCGALSN